MVEKRAIPCKLVLIFVAALALSSTLLGVERAWADSVIKTITGFSDPWSIAFNPHNNDMYVASTDAGNGIVYVIDSSSNTVVHTISVGGGPEQYIAYNPSNNDMYVSNSGGTTVSVIDSSSNTVVDTIRVGGGPQGIAFNPTNNDMYVTSGAGTVSVIDSSSNTVVDTIALEQAFGHYRIAFNPTNNDMYVTNYVQDGGAGTVSVIDSTSNTVVKTIGAGGSPFDIAFNPTNHDMYVTNDVFVSGTVSVIDSTSNTVVKTIGVGSFPMSIAFNPTNHDMYVANFNSETDRSGTVSVIDSSSNTVVDTISVGDGATSIAFNPTNNDMYVVNTNSDTVSVISTSTVVQPPTHTTITSAVDGNEAAVQSGGSTVSTSITFHVTATPGTNPIAGFECSLDGSAFSSCATTNPATISYNNLAAGQPHTFTVRAVDTQGNVDPTPASFTWTILTPTQGIQKLIGTINSFHLPRGVTTSLEAPLNAAIMQLNRHNNVAACNQMTAFLNQVSQKQTSGQLTPQQAADLRQQAIAIQRAIGCSSVGLRGLMPSSSGDEGEGEDLPLPMP